MPSGYRTQVSAPRYQTSRSASVGHLLVRQLKCPLQVLACLFSALECLNAWGGNAPVLQSAGQGYNIGAWYYTAWNASNNLQALNSISIYGTRDPWGGVREYAEGADPWGLHTDYSNRAPLLGFYDLLDQQVMDSHIRQAASSGLSFFAFYWYWNTDLNREDPARSAGPLQKLLTSSLKSQFRFLIAPIAKGSAPMTLSMWSNSVVPFLVTRYLSEPSYLKTIDDRPVIVLFSLGFTNALEER